MLLQTPIVTARLMLRSLTEADATEAYLRWLNDPLVTRYIESRFSRFALESLREYIRADNVSPDTLLLGIFLSEGRHIGNVKLATVDFNNLTAEIGIMIGERDTWGRGLATEVIEAIARYAFESLNLEKLFAKCYASNEGSSRVFRKAGFILEGRLRSHVSDFGQRDDVLSVGLTRADWMARRRHENGQVGRLVAGARFATHLDLESQALSHWDKLHTEARIRLRYPSEPVIRFLVRNYPEAVRSVTRVLDIGAGGGRHVKLLCDLGFRTYGVDISGEGLRHCRAWLTSDGQAAELRQASMFHLPFPDDSMDAAISFAVFYYADVAGMRRAVSEMHRVLRPSGRALVLTPTDADYRYGKGTCLEPHTFRLGIDNTDEHGCVMHFLREEDVTDMFRAFAEVRFEKTEGSFDDRKAANSDWLIEVRK